MIKCVKFKLDAVVGLAIGAIGGGYGLDADAPAPGIERHGTGLLVRCDFTTATAVSIRAIQLQQPR